MAEVKSEESWIYIGETIPDTGEAAKFVSRPDCGAVNLFQGITRNHDSGRKVISLYYDCYQEMAMSELQKIIRLITSNYGTGRIAVLHRTGEVPVGEISMIVAISAAHRRQAIDATLELIDRLKQDVPIWKKEAFEKGSFWKEELE